jgi:chemotaxis protein histidine kinase CheA
MPCGAIFENTTGITKRNKIQLTDDEISLIKDFRRDLEIEFEFLAGEKGTRVHDNQTKVAEEIIEGFNKGTLINTMVVSPTQSGKTGIICETIRLFIKETDIDYKNIYIITGLSSVEWKKQTKNRLPEKMKNQVFHRCDLLTKFYKDIERKKNVLIILDEIQIASAKDQTIHKVFDELNYMNLATLLKKDVKFLEITATPNGSIYDLMKWGENFCSKIIVQPPEAYTSCFNLYDDERVKQFKDLCDDVLEDKQIISAIDNIKELKETIDTYYQNDDYRFHFIRTKAAELQEKTKNNFKQVFGDDVQIIEFDMENKKESDINNIVSEKPNEHIFIFIKEKLRCAKTIENKNLVGVYYERFTISPDDDVIIQGMLGRATGYNDNGDSIIYTNIPSIEKYKKLLKSNFEDRTINWISSSTTMKNEKIRSVNYYNTPDNIKGFKVVKYDDDTETPEEKKKRIAKQKQEREERKQNKELEKAEKQKVKEAKEKEKEQKKLEKEAKQKEREAMKKAKEALKEQQKKEKEELKEALKENKEPKEKKEKEKTEPKKSEDIPEVQPRRKKLRNLNKKIFDDEE